LIVHGGIEPGCTPEESDVRLLCKIRTWDGQGKHLNRQGIDSPWYQFYHGDELVVYGHWAEQGLTIRKKTIGIDSGCVYGRSLTAISLPDRTIHQVAAKQVYQSLLS
jgi:bis(5'-nucleosyl)-tetraphosphatase (symmetrical)